MSSVNPTALYYTKGKFGKLYRQTVDTDTTTLYSKGQYKTDFTEDDLPAWYCPIQSRDIWYMKGWLNCRGVTDIAYTYMKENHVFKDDYIYLKYGGKLEVKERKYGFVDYPNADISICGNEIIDIIRYIEKYSPNVNTKAVKALIKEKILYLKNFERDYYKSVFHTDELVDVFKIY